MEECRCITHVCDVFQASLSSHVCYSSEYSKTSGFVVGLMWPYGFEPCVGGHALTSDCYLWGHLDGLLGFQQYFNYHFHIATVPPFHAVSLKSCSFCRRRRQLPSSSVCLGSSRYGFTLYLLPFHDDAYFVHYRP